VLEPYGTLKRLKWLIGSVKALLPNYQPQRL
jgi:hypothetical protein